MFVPRQLSTHKHFAPVEVEDNRHRWDLRPYILAVNGEPREFFTIGHLAGALLRSAMTIRGWERDGLFPKPTFTVNGADPRRRRRLYTRQQIAGVLRIAEEEGLMDARQRYLRQTRFPERCHQLFQQIGKELPPPLPLKETA